MARESKLDPELLRQMIAMQANPQTEFDPSKISAGAIKGMDLAATIEQRRNAQSDREKALREKIEQAVREKKLVKQLGGSPVVQAAADVSRPEAAKQILQSAFDEKKNEEKPDNIKQIMFVPELNKTVGVTYGGQVKEINLGGRGAPAAAPQLPAAETGKLAELGQVLKKLQRAKQIFDSSATRDASGQVVESPLVGAVDNALNRAKEFTGSPEAATTEFRTLVTNNINQQIKAITGAQLSEPEAQRIMKALPSLNLGDVAFDQRIQDAIKITEDIIKEKQAAFSTGFSGVPSVLPGAQPKQPNLDINALGAALGLPRKGAK